MVKKKIHTILAIIICHGKSELIFTKNIKSNLKLKIVLESKNKGQSSIQLTSLNKFLKSKIIKISNLKKIYKGQLNEETFLTDFRIFTIMDIDEKELTSEMIDNYKSKKMFDEFDFKDMIVPIYNDKNLEDVLLELGYDVDRKNKVESYYRIFPGNNGDYESFKKIMEDFKKSNKSNMIELLDFLNQQIKK